MRARLRSEGGFSLVELIVVMLLLGIVMTAIVSLFVSSVKATSQSTERVAGQGRVRVAVTRLEYEVRCASGATVTGGGSTVTVSLRSECIHGTGDYTWCVSGAKLYRTAGDSCLTTGQVMASTVTTPTPFTLLTATGYLPRLQIALTVNDGGGSTTDVSLTDVITLRNGLRS
jgi:prepilin-type N-terminal cleavage/methylation domain-containing protein